MFYTCVIMNALLFLILLIISFIWCFLWQVCNNKHIISTQTKLERRCSAPTVSGETTSSCFSYFYRCSSGFRSTIKEEHLKEVKPNNLWLHHWAEESQSVPMDARFKKDLLNIVLLHNTTLSMSRQKAFSSLLFTF